MSSLIKGNGAPIRTPVRPLSWINDGASEGEAAIALDSPPDRDPEFMALERVVLELRRKLDEQEAMLVSSVESARADGKKQAELAYAREDSEALATLRGGVENAARHLDERLAAMEALALAISHTALEKVFANAQTYQDLVGRAIARQMAHLKKETVLRIVVSASDFPSDAAVQAATQNMSAGNIEILRDHQLPRGACRIDLRLGRIELSISKHWENLQDLLQTLAEDKRA